MTESTQPKRPRPKKRPQARRPRAAAKQHNAPVNDTGPETGLDGAGAPTAVPTAQAGLERSAEAMAQGPPAEAEDPVEQAVGEVPHEPPATAEQPPQEAEEPTAEAEEATTGAEEPAAEAEEPATEAEEPATEAEEAEVPSPERMAQYLRAAWSKPRSGFALLEQQMSRSSFRKMVIERVVKKLR